MIDVIVSLKVSWSSRDDVEVNLVHCLPCIWSILHKLSSVESWRSHLLFHTDLY